MGGEFGSKNDMLGAGLNPVARNHIWAEHCKKEVRGMKLNTDFRISHPDHMQVITEKPNYVVPSTQTDAATLDRSTKQLVELCTTYNDGLAPNEKFKLPQTTTQQYGFFANQQINTGSNFFDHKRHAGEVTKYADSYYSMTGRTPFSKAPDPVV
mmetsp:Transcript_26254/g.67528  ORF Transcript_26254/g.67528 Transcript_26254/m.67528 type:complete len:154 (+) Transcript_26254:155-616(+)|eukprot:jgi/Tetstr1/436299/TSEL_025139.t1